MRVILYRWWHHWQWDITLGPWRYFCVGAAWRDRPRLIAYYSRNATPWHHSAHGWGADKGPRCVCDDPRCTAPARRVTSGGER